MAWKDFLQFSTGERIGILVLLGLILVFLAAPFVYRSAAPEKTTDFSKFDEAVARFEAKLEESIMAREAERENRRTWQNQTRGQRFSQNQQISLNPFRFNPNKLPVSEWKRMGIPENIATRIHNFEKAGGSFRFKEDLARIYSITDEIYNQLEPFIDLPSRSSRTERHFASANDRDNSFREITNTTRSIVNLNSADSATLVTVRGIGPAFSSRIIRYRERLGGFVNVDQLMEVFGMDSTRFEQIRNWFEIDPNLVSRINVNSSTWEELVKHPYINGNIASSIIAFRRQHGPYATMADLKKSKLISDSLFSRISPYISIE
jgi:competence ComEA-like helix-hairpin-helix protein